MKKKNVDLFEFMLKKVNKDVAHYRNDFKYDKADILR